MTPSSETKELASDAHALLKPDGSGPMAGGDRSNGVSNVAKDPFSLSKFDATAKPAASPAEVLPGSDTQLLELIKDSPFLDFNSPMTPYEWFKFVIMVRSTFPTLAFHSVL